MMPHQRGCAGRDYTCTCGYEDARDSRLKAGDAALRSTAAACADHVNTIIQLRSELADFRQEVGDALKIAREAAIEECAKALEDDAKQCDCFARNEGECGCGAWCEWKSITSARAVEIVRSLC